MSKSTFRLAWFASLLVIVAVSCNLVSNIGNQVQGVQGTAQSVITQAQGYATQGGAVIGTAKAFATEHPSMVNTAMAFVTEEGSSMLGTAEAYATENPGLLETAQAYITEEGPGLLQTAQSLGTDNPGLMETANAVQTQFAPQSGGPADVPVVPGEKASFFANENIVSYMTPMDFNSVLSFYQEGMQAKGWAPVDQDTVIGGDVAVLVYTKGGNTARVTLTHNSSGNETVVLATVEGS